MRVLLVVALMASPLMAQDNANRGTEFMVNRLKDRLKLTDEQTAKVKEILTKDGEERSKMDEARTEKINALLNDEQKTKLDGLVERATGMMRMIPNLMNRGGNAAPAPRPSAEDKAARAVAALKIEKDDEKTAITDLVTKIVKAQYDLEDYTKTSRDRMSEAAKNHDLSDAAVEDRIKESQEERRKREKDIAALQKQLAEVVTNRQELELMAQGILK